MPNEIQNTAFQRLIDRLGINNPVRPFKLSNIVTPISIVDQDIELSQVQIPLLSGAPATVGELVAPLAAVILADTGALAAGTWAFLFWISCDDTLKTHIQHRDAANATNNWQMFVTQRRDGVSWSHFSIRITILSNERVRVLTQAAVAGGSLAQAQIFPTQIS